MSDEHFVVIGNGPAGNQAALTLREEAPEARVTLISRDPESCYRPHMLPGLIAGETSEGALFVSSRESYKAKGIKLRCGQSVVRINPALRALVLDHREILHYTGLIIAVGGRPRIPESLIRFRDHMFELKTLYDTRRWAGHLSGVDTVLMIGGDLTSFAVTKALLHLKKKVYFMLDEGSFWPLRTDMALFDEVASKLTEKNVEVLKGSKINSIKRLDENTYEVEVGRLKINVNMIGAFFGLVPDIGFLSGSGLRCDRGVLVDEYLNTGFKEIYATGDCAQIYHRDLRDYWISIGHDNAVALGRIAALNLTGWRMKADVPLESLYGLKGIKVNTSWWMEF